MMSETSSTWQTGFLQYIQQLPRDDRRTSGYNHNRLLGFIKEAHPLLLPPVSPPVHRGARPDSTRLQSVLSELSPAMLTARGAGVFANPWHVAGLGRNEVRNAAVLAALWSPSVTGDVAAIFLNAFLRRLPTEFPLPSLAQLMRPYHVRTEHCAAGAITERVDITIEGEKFVLGVEVKIDAEEGPTQLKRYSDTISSWGRARAKDASVVLLARFSPSRSDVTGARWEDVVAAANAATPNKRRDWDYAHYLIHSFAQHVARFRKAGR